MCSSKKYESALINENFSRKLKQEKIVQGIFPAMKTYK